ncbi:Hemophore-related protein OS=Tsukamurella paurometabola (strain ATCC 8368 / DSM / CCUG 35730/ CIP 100753 / JCM 10117 / KCTC 9821 / NBRC 16120 / NCIMB 702349/ NCTC 13040) OX=521096 GN=Tpau_2736 PE=4 SV=1 [Tsukamurella paurometabola]|uniref:Hemophore-related protein n=1 Tax=Tsukamurella paurometabola (strain ATCC 8368 / DSM 20162 / CCUG 35730 / CIP 100753 / JCM 10117 / KCTC 9821 / NBRC 16120 / NCIMB 702349 / NCTC 13040) TaxID=521096 RepID=D5USR3_TSUPD|nr:hemophore-related protein [Tsukamurella paurometabola]ADG79334.1 conserved hypothetical protein [Tsukamurella paurometabola DSM 20162]SUP35131.1 Uncharacterised protein [Tsukamurella paurometabola]
MQTWKFAAATAFTGTLIAAPVATAAAAPADPVPGTQCTVAQVERAVTDLAPEAIPMLNQVPGGRATAEQVLTLPPAERNARLHQLANQNPQLAAFYNANQGEINKRINLVVSNCAKY